MEVSVPVPLPVKVKVGVPVVEEKRMVPAPNVNAPEPDASSVAPPAPIVNKRLVVCTAPVYCKVPPLITRLPAALVD